MKLINVYIFLHEYSVIIKDALVVGEARIDLGLQLNQQDTHIFCRPIADKIFPCFAN